MIKHEQISAKISGKILVVIFGAEADDWAVISDPRLDEQAGRLFLMGTVPANVLPGFEGVTVGLAWDRVQQYFVLESAEDYERARMAYCTETKVTAKDFLSYFWRRRRN